MLVNSAAPVVVCGGGIIGAAVGYYLTKMVLKRIESIQIY